MGNGQSSKTEYKMPTLEEHIEQVKNFNTEEITLYTNKDALDDGGAYNDGTRLTKEQQLTQHKEDTETHYFHFGELLFLPIYKENQEKAKELLDKFDHLGDNNINDIVENLNNEVDSEYVKKMKEIILLVKEYGISTLQKSYNLNGGKRKKRRRKSKKSRRKTKRRKTKRRKTKRRRRRRRTGGLPIDSYKSAYGPPSE